MILGNILLNTVSGEASKPSQSCPRKLCDSSFLDLFLDTESRQRFLQFLAEEDPETTDVAIPRGLRVSLQGAAGPVSMDLFHTRIPNQGTTGRVAKKTFKIAV